MNRLFSKRYDPKERIDFLHLEIDECTGEKNELLEEVKMLSEKLESAIYKLRQLNIDVERYKPPRESIYWQGEYLANLY